MRWPSSTIMSDQAYFVLLSLMHTNTHFNTLTLSSPHLIHQATSLVSLGIGLMKHGERHSWFHSWEQKSAALRSDHHPLIFSSAESCLLHLKLWHHFSWDFLAPKANSGFSAPCHLSFFTLLYFLSMFLLFWVIPFDYMVSWLPCSLSLLIHS